MTKVNRFSTALRPHVTTKIEQLGYADIVIGIPTYYSGGSIVHVIKTVIKGIELYYPNMKAVIMVSDGGSTDDTSDLARTVDPKSYNIESIITTTGAFLERGRDCGPFSRLPPSSKPGP